MHRRVYFATRIVAATATTASVANTTNSTSEFVAARMNELRMGPPKNLPLYLTSQFDPFADYTNFCTQNSSFLGSSELLDQFLRIRHQI